MRSYRATRSVAASDLHLPIINILVRGRFTLGNLQIGPSLMTAAESYPTSPWIALANHCSNGSNVPP